jgi:phospholipid N-methyltransferase
MNMAHNEHTAPAPNGVKRPINRPAQLLLFAKNFLKHPNMLGWMFPSSPLIVEEVLKQVDWPNTRLIVEYGPGLGTFTRDILHRMHPDARLVALETNDEFYKYLCSDLRDPRFHLLHESATEVSSVLKRLELPAADYIISGIPFKTLREDLRGEIVRRTHAALRPDGRFLVYQMSSAVRPYLQSVFGRVQEDYQRVNALPARLYYCAR